MSDERQIDAGPVLAALGGLLLLVSLFLDWFKPDTREAISAWTAFESLDLLLAATALGALLALAGVFVRGVPSSRVLLPLGALAFLVVLSQLIDPPPTAGEESELETGVWLGLAGSALMLAGAILSTAHVSLTVAPRPDAAAAPPAPGTGVSEGAAAAPGETPRPAEVEAGARAEARENEPEVQSELYPEEERKEPLGSGDPEPWSASPDDQTEPLPESGKREPGA